MKFIKAILKRTKEIETTKKEGIYSPPVVNFDLPLSNLYFKLVQLTIELSYLIARSTYSSN